MNISDISVKENIRSIESPLTAVLQIRGIQYDLKREYYTNTPEERIDELVEEGKNAGFGIAHIGDSVVQCKYVASFDKNGEVLFEDIEAGEYYLTVYARQLYRYTQKYIEIPVGDTLKLKKDFTPDGAYIRDLEPWDHEVQSQ